MFVAYRDHIPCTVVLRRSCRFIVYKNNAPAPTTTAKADNPTAITELLSPNRAMAPDAADEVAPLAAPDAAEAARLVAEETTPPVEPDREADPEAEPVIIDEEADLVIDADEEPLIEPVDWAAATASEAIPFPTDEKVWQLDEAGVEYGVCGVTVWPTVHNSVAPPEAV